MSEQANARQPMPLADMIPGSVLEQEWNTFRRERPRLLAEGHEGRWVLVKGEEIIGIWETRREACKQGYKRYLLVPFLVHQLQYVERVYRTGYWNRWPT
jgi:hypothetical protein